MNYYKDSNGNVYAFDDLQVAMGLAGDLIPMTPAEVDAHLNPPAPISPNTPEIDYANPTVAEWNALCEAAGATELMK